MSKENQALVLQSVNNFAFENRDVPELRDEYCVRVLIQQIGICASDIHYWQHGRIGDLVINNPLVLGHESSGKVVEVGKKVQNVKVGDIVAIEPGDPCRRCVYCHSGGYNLCTDIIFAGTPPGDGTLQKYFIAASDFCYPLPPSMNAEDGALIEPLAVAVSICKTAGLKAGQTVLVFGCGSIGVLTQAVAKAYGAKVIGINRSKPRALFAKSFGTSDQIIRKFDLGDGADAVLECTGAESFIQAGIFATRLGGTYVQAGFDKENAVFPITSACLRALNVKGVMRYTTGCYRAAIDLVASGKIDVRSLITHRFKFEQALEAFELIKGGEPNRMKVMIQGVQ
ncbi:GroES-like protein [Annulohypoxylon nitens]|nr:GroES-like protein [Annulohypoxylon nitens]